MLETHAEREPLLTGLEESVVELQVISEYLITVSTTSFEPCLSS